MASPKSQIKALFDGIRSAPPLATWEPFRAILGRRGLSKQGAPPRLVLYPSEGKMISPKKHPQTSIRDVERQIVAHLWGADFDQLEELENRFFQALEYQAAGGYPSNAGAVPGQFWMGVAEDWEVTPDDNSQGEEVFVLLSLMHSIDRAAQTTGGVLVVALSDKSTVLTSSMTPVATTANALTDGFPSSGILSIDSEQIQYTGTTATSFTGLVRGINYTTPSTHSSGATVTVT